MTRDLGGKKSANMCWHLLWKLPYIIIISCYLFLRLTKLKIYFGFFSIWWSLCSILCGFKGIQRHWVSCLILLLYMHACKWRSGKKALENKLNCQNLTNWLTTTSLGESIKVNKRLRSDLLPTLWAEFRSHCEKFSEICLDFVAHNLLTICSQYAKIWSTFAFAFFLKFWTFD